MELTKRKLESKISFQEKSQGWGERFINHLPRTDSQKVGWTLKLDCRSTTECLFTGAPSRGSPLAGGGLAERGKNQNILM